jgi:hypothetical protein
MSGDGIQVVDFQVTGLEFCQCGVSVTGLAGNIFIKMRVKFKNANDFVSLIFKKSPSV